MADQDRNRDRGQDVHLEDVMGVGTRVSWGAILAGVVMALALCFVLTLLGTAIGFSVSDSVEGDTLGMGAGIWAAMTMIVGLFVGGWICSQCIVGETKTESIVHGIIMWGVVVAMLLYLAASGISSAFGGMMQVANVAGDAAQSTDDQTWQRMASAAGVSQGQIEQWTSQASSSAQDPEKQAAAAENAQETATHAAWWSLGGTVLSMISAVVGAMLGAGPSFRLLPVHVNTRRPIAGGV